LGGFRYERGGKGTVDMRGREEEAKTTNKQTKPPQEPPKQTPLNASSSLNATRNGAVTEQAPLVAFLRRGVSKGDDDGGGGGGGAGESGDGKGIK